MMYPAAVNGHMPFVDAKKYRDSQIKKVIAKHRQRHNSGPEKYSLERSKIHNANAKSLPQLNQNAASSPRIGRPRFISMPSLESQNNLVNLEQDSTSSQTTKQRIVHSIKQFFTGGNKESKKKYQPHYEQNKSSRAQAHSAPIDILSRSRANVNCEASSPPSVVSAKRQRTRTVSNISSVMETIEEIPENFVLEGDTDSEESELQSNCSSNSLTSMMSSQSEPGTLSHLHRLSNINSRDSLLPSSNEVICAA